MENLYSGSVHQCVASAPEVSLHSVLLQLRAICSAPQDLHCVVGRQVVQHLMDSTTAVPWQAEWDSQQTPREAVGAYTFYYETSQDLWDLFSSSVLYIACLHTHIVLGIVFGYECLTIYLMYG